MPVKVTTQQFIEKAQAVHGIDRYNYGAVRYECAIKKVVIVCPIHGHFEQTPNAHLNGQGCVPCGRERISAARNKGLSAFIKQAKATHGDLYNYDAVVYQGGHSNVTIICAKHGAFFQLPINHLKGCGCAKCGVVRTVASKLKDLDWFIAGAKKQHGERYKYENAIYTGVYDKLLITCSLHGDFLQSPSGHMRGQGCPRCAGYSSSAANRSQLHLRPASRSGWISRQRDRNATLYLIKAWDEGEAFYKVGITYNIDKRFAGARMPYNWAIIKTFKSSDAGAVYDAEKLLHRKAKCFKYRPKQPFGGASECFSEEALEPILSIFPL